MARPSTLSKRRGAAVLRYVGLLATDATGRNLPARLAVASADGAPEVRASLELVVDASGAASPLEVTALVRARSQRRPPATSLTLARPGPPRATRRTPLWFFGRTAGDVNGDGYADVIVGAPSTTTASRRGPGLCLPRLGRAGSAPRRPGRARATRPAPASAGPWRRRATSTATATPTSSSARHYTTTARPTRAGPSSTTARPPGWAPPRPGRRRATRPAPGSASPWRRPATSTATATPT